jgi:hypothetical protein
LFAIWAEADVRRLVYDIKTRLVNDTSIFKTANKARYRRSLLWLPSLQSCRPPQRAIAQRFSALALNIGYRDAAIRERSDE